MGSIESYKIKSEILDVYQDLSSEELVRRARELSKLIKPFMINEEYYDDSSLYIFYSKTLVYTNMEDLLSCSNPEARDEMESFFKYCVKNYKLFFLRKNIFDKNYNALNEILDLEDIRDIQYNFSDIGNTKVISLGLNPLNMEFSSGVSSWFNGRGIEITVINKEHGKTFIETIHVRHDLEIPDNTIFVCQEKNIDEYICFLSLKKEVSLRDGTVMYLAKLLKKRVKL